MFFTVLICKMDVSLFTRPLRHAVRSESTYSLTRNKIRVPNTVLDRCFGESFTIIFGSLIFVFDNKSTALQRTKSIPAWRTGRLVPGERDSSNGDVVGLRTALGTLPVLVMEPRFLRYQARSTEKASDIRVLHGFVLVFKTDKKIRPSVTSVIC